MKLLNKSLHKEVGLIPGALIHVGERKADETQIELIEYDGDNVSIERLDGIEKAFHIKRSNRVSWLNIDGLHDTPVFEKVGSSFDIHPLVMEDILNTHQRPKIEDFGDYIFLVLKMISYNENENDIESEQVSLILGSGFVITFQEKHGDVFDPIRERLKKAKGRIRDKGADYLAYNLLDAIVDNYYVVVGRISERIESLESSIVEAPTPKSLHELHRLKSRIVELRRSIWPLREIVNSLIKSESKLIEKGIYTFMQDLHDHAIQVTDSIDTFRDMLSGLMDLYMSTISNRTNEVMKILTIFAAIFIPLTFIVGIYGMNFEYMPELKLKFAYPVIWGILLMTAGGMLLFFKRRKWF